MATTPRDRLDRELARVDDMDATDKLRARLREFADVLDANKPTDVAINGDGEQYDCAPRTVESYVKCVRIATEHGLAPLSADTAAVNAVIEQLSKDRADKTMLTYQAALRAFYHAFDLEADPSNFITFSPDHTPRHDEQDMFTEDEVWALCDACGRTRAPVRNRAFLELLIFSGQRVRALVTLRCADVDVKNGAFYLNDAVDGLKNATQRGRKRPLLGARKYVADWLDAHPTGDGWLFVGDPNHWKTDTDDHWAEVSVDQVLRRIGGHAGVDKPVNAHNFRHYAATVLRRDYDLGWDRIGALFGVVRGSTMPETTYSHIDDSDLMADIEAAMGYAEHEERDRFTPPVCPTCGEVLKSGWRECPNCREVFGVDAQMLDDFLVEESVSAEEGLDRAVADSLRRLGFDAQTDPS